MSRCIKSLIVVMTLFYLTGCGESNLDIPSGSDSPVVDETNQPQSNSETED